MHLLATIHAVQIKHEGWTDWPHDLWHPNRAKSQRSTGKKVMFDLFAVQDALLSWQTVLEGFETSPKHKRLEIEGEHGPRKVTIIGFSKRSLSNVPGSHLLTSRERTLERGPRPPVGMPRRSNVDDDKSSENDAASVCVPRELMVNPIRVSARTSATATNSTRAVRKRRTGVRHDDIVVEAAKNPDAPRAKRRRTVRVKLNI